MTNKSPFNTLLVPTDFSEVSQAAFQWALRSVDGDQSVLIVLHVLDKSLIDSMAEVQIAEREKIVSQMRKAAEVQIASYRESAGSGVEIDAIVTEGVPFFEIVRKAKDFAVDAIVMSKVGAGRELEHLLFGSTVDKVLRASRHPVVVLSEGRLAPANPPASGEAS